MPKINLIEPADGEFVRTGDKWPYTFWQRDDETARDVDDDLENPADPDARWWDCAQEDGGEGPDTWEYVSSRPDPRAVGFVTIRKLPAEAAEADRKHEDLCTDTHCPDFDDDCHCWCHAEETTEVGAKAVDQ